MPGQNCQILNKCWGCLIEKIQYNNYVKLFVLLIHREIAVEVVPYSPGFGLVLIGGKMAKEEQLEDHLQ